jgi:hypothetical protein
MNWTIDSLRCHITNVSHGLLLKPIKKKLFPGLEMPVSTVRETALAVACSGLGAGLAR